MQVLTPQMTQISATCSDNTSGHIEMIAAPKPIPNEAFPAFQPSSPRALHRVDRNFLTATEAQREK
jgi:hypothetical protein